MAAAAKMQVAADVSAHIHQQAGSQGQILTREVLSVNSTQTLCIAYSKVH